ncbi:MAG: hypothetical protein HYX59_12595 [Elusimicrobia bacterium]|nr:hypothetical protein [Elusimicrobiota bacterium]
MDLVPGLKQLEGTLALTADRIAVVKSKLEDLLFRAQKISAAAKNNMKDNDTMYGYDLQNFRRDLRTFGMDLTGLTGLLAGMERIAEYDVAAGKFATGVMRAASRVSNSMKTLHDMSLLAHQHIRQNDQKMLAWYIAQEIEEMMQKCAGLPAIANKIVILTTTEKPGAQPPAGAAPPAPAAPASPEPPTKPA